MSNFKKSIHQHYKKTTEERSADGKKVSPPTPPKPRK